VSGVHLSPRDMHVRYRTKANQTWPCLRGRSCARTDFHPAAEALGRDLENSARPDGGRWRPSATRKRPMRSKQKIIDGIEQAPVDGGVNWPRRSGLNETRTCFIRPKSNPSTVGKCLANPRRWVRPCRSNPEMKLSEIRSAENRLFTPLRLRDATSRTRVVISTECVQPPRYANDGTAHRVKSHWWGGCRLPKPQRRPRADHHAISVSGLQIRAALQAVTSSSPVTAPARDPDAHATQGKHATPLDAKARWIMLSPRAMAWDFVRPQCRTAAGC